MSTATTIFTTSHTTVKAPDLQHDPRIGLCVDDERPPFSFVLIEGTQGLATTWTRCGPGPHASPGATWALCAQKAYGAWNGRHSRVVGMSFSTGRTSR